MTVPAGFLSALEGRYSIEREIGRGGMATVYLARDIRHDRLVALKILNPELAAVLGAERFLAEIKVTANLKHPNLLPLFDSGEAGGLLFYTMPFIEGESLRGRLDREKQLPIDQAVRMASSIGEALDYAHRHGVIHRDLKPENILIHEGQPLIADFGIALAVSNAGGPRVTQTGISLGTPQYMSPEQATGDRSVDARSDIYSLGALTFEMLTGEPPHTGTTAQAIIAKLLTEAPRSLTSLRRTVPPHVEAAVLHALEKLPADRFETAREFAHALVNPSATQHLTGVQQAARDMRRPQWMYAAAIAVVAVTATLAGIAIGRARSSVTSEMARLQLYLADTIRVGLSTPPLLAFSPNGDQVAFSPGAGEIRMLSLTDPASRPIAGTEGGVGPAFSHDGKKLAFGRAGALYVVPVEGGTAERVADSTTTASWGDKGTLFFRRGMRYWALREGSVRAEPVASVDSLLRWRIIGATVLPGEKYLLLTIIRPDRQTGSIVSIELATGKVDSLGIAGSSPRYSETGHLVYVDSTRAIVAAPFSIRTRRVTGPPVVILRNVRRNYSGLAHYAISQRGHLVAMSERGAALMELFMVNEKGEERRVSSELRSYSWLRLSPDGRRIAMEIAEGGAGPWNLWTMDVATGALNRLTSGNSGIRPQGWTPDSRNVYYLTSRRTSVVVRAADGTGEPRTVATFPADVAQGSVDSAGRVMVVRSGSNISLARLDSATAPRVLFEDERAGATPSISPDGKLVAYTTEVNGRDEVYVRAVDGSGRERVSVNGGIQPLWDRRGTAVFYRDASAVRRATIARTPVLAVTRQDSLFPVEGYASGSMTWAVMPDDRNFLMLRDRTSATYPVLVLNWARRQE